MDKPDGLPTDLSVDQLRWLLGGVSARRLEQPAAAGVIERTARGRYSIKAVPAYFRFQRQAEVRGGKNWQDVRVQVAREKLEILRLERAERERRAVPTDAVIRWITSVVTVAKTRLMGIGVKLAPRLASERAPARCQLLVEAEIVEALRELSQIQVVPESVA
jgi:hypothetical protein